LFGTEAIRTFLSRAGLKLMIRAHQCVADGFFVFAQNTRMTVFSSSDYCRMQHNLCGVVLEGGGAKAGDDIGEGVGNKTAVLSVGEDSDERADETKSAMQVGKSNAIDGDAEEKTGRSETGESKGIDSTNSVG
jgi:hypothetical protein